jgi:hypothetical protein
LIVVGLWVFSYQSRIDIRFPVRAGNTRRQIFANQGLILFLGCEQYPVDEPGTVIFGRYEVPEIFNANYWTGSTLGFFRRTTQVPFQSTLTKTGFWVPRSNRGWMNRNAVSVPYWSLATTMTIILLAMLQRRLRARQRHREGLCPVCGYDLRATPDRCPECGAEAKPGVAGTGRA